MVDINKFTCLDFLCAKISIQNLALENFELKKHAIPEKSCLSHDTLYHVKVFALTRFLHIMNYKFKQAK